MAGFVSELQKSLGRALKSIHKIEGTKVRYTLITDTTDPKNNNTVLDIFVHLTEQVRMREAFQGRITESLSAAGILSAEALPVYVVSRESLKIGTTFHKPTIFDSFRELDATVSPNVPVGPTLFVQQITNIGGLPTGFRLLTVAKFSEHVRG